jgi:hypothetical protein
MVDRHGFAGPYLSFMRIDEIQGEQQLLERFARAKRSVIMELSGDFDGDLARLREVCGDYATRHGVPMPPADIFLTGAEDF